MKRSRKIAAVPITAIKTLESRARNRSRFKELVRSIERQGLKKPIAVCKRDTGLYDLVCGEARMDAFSKLGQQEVPVILTDASVEDCILMRLIENFARRRHKSLELVSEIGRLAKHYLVPEIAAKLDLGQEYVGAVVYLLKKGEGRLISAVDRGIVPLTLAVEIARAKSPKLQGALLESYINEHHTSRQITKLRKLVEQRHRGAMKAQFADEKINSASLVHAYRQETSRQEVMARQADLAHARLVFIVNGLKTLLGERMFMSLLRTELMDKLPLPLLTRLSSASVDSHDREAG